MSNDSVESAETPPTDTGNEIEMQLYLPTAVIAHLNMIAELSNQPINTVVNVILAMTIYQQVKKT